MASGTDDNLPHHLHWLKIAEGWEVVLGMEVSVSAVREWRVEQWALVAFLQEPVKSTIFCDDTIFFQLNNDLLFKNTIHIYYI